MEKGNWDKLIRFSDWWSHKNLHKFPYWTRCDIKHEVILAYFDIKHRYNPSKGGLNSFLSNSIWDPVFRSYAKQRDIQISRPGQVRGGPTVKRIYTDRLFFVEKYPEIKVLKKEEHEHQIPDIPEWFLDITDLVMRGLTQRQIGYALGVSESRICQRMSDLRRIFRVK